MGGRQGNSQGHRPQDREPTSAAVARPDQWVPGKKGGASWRQVPQEAEADLVLEAALFSPLHLEAGLDQVFFLISRLFPFSLSLGSGYSAPARGQHRVAEELCWQGSMVHMFDS